ncbi:MAG: hypothetical protein M3154_07580 [Candidatus Eremiobacteraeota bacterium]|nr:hypothetical protein [Candidatus Eremiobacteraeota bacterium]
MAAVDSIAGSPPTRRVAAGGAAARVDTVSTARPAVGRVRIDLPLLDVPYNTGYGGRAPSMEQSLDVSAGVYDAAHLGIARAFGRRRVLGKIAIAAFDVFGAPAPLADAWLHEEWHRAVLGARGVDSYDDVYRFDFTATSISVSHVSDDALAAMKRAHPAEFVRLKAAGIEGDYALVTRLEQAQFYRGDPAWHAALYWATTLNSVLYVADMGSIDADTRTMNAAEPTVAVRDISGHDFTAWVRDLFRPGEAWEARGVHPSGVGVNRYVLTTDLTPEERAYLHHEGRLAFLNFVNPNLLGMRDVTLRNPIGGGALRANLALQHLLTSFGHTVDGQLFVQQGRTNAFVVLHAYANHERTLPGADAEILDYPVTLGGRAVTVSPRVALWAQPHAQQFRTHDAQAGALAALRVRMPVARWFGALAEVEGKTAGWVAGVVQLDRAVNARFGISAVVP